jgi:antitoxin HicB
MSELHYSMLIQWSDEDQAYLVRLPDWERAERVLGPVTHGETYAEALEHGLERSRRLLLQRTSITRHCQNHKRSQQHKSARP